MPVFGPSLRTLVLRSAPTTLRSTSTQLHTQFVPQFNNNNNNNNSGPQQQQLLQQRPPSPPSPTYPAPPYQARNHTLLASPSQWTRFSTPYTLSSVRTFTSTPSSSRFRSHASSPSSASTATLHDPELALTLDTLQDLYEKAREDVEDAAEEVAARTAYAEDDCAQARETLGALVDCYRGFVEGRGGEVVERRFGARVRELEGVLVGLEASLMVAE